MSGKRATNGKPKLNGKNARNPDGTFAPGNPGGPGRKRGAKTEFVIAAMDRSLTAKRAEAIVERYLLACEAGEPWALKDFLDRCLGKPKETVEVDASVALTVADFFREAARRADTLARN